MSAGFLVIKALHDSADADGTATDIERIDRLVDAVRVMSNGDLVAALHTIEQLMDSGEEMSGLFRMEMSKRILKGEDFSPHISEDRRHVMTEQQTKLQQMDATKRAMGL